MTKTMKKAISIIIAVTMIMMLGISSLAADYTISITRSDKDMATHTYKAYQIFTGELYNDGTSTKLINLAAGDNLNLATLKTQLGLASTATIADVINGLNNISEAEAAKKIQASVKTTPAPLQAVSGSSVTTTINAVPGPGYYLITDTINRSNTAEGGLQGAESVFMLQVLGADTAVTVNAKTDNPTMDKVIDEGATGVRANTASIGDKVPFKITSEVPDHSRYNRYWFKVTDVLSKGLTFNAADLEITVGGTKLASTAYTLDTSTDSDGFTTIEITFVNFKQHAIGSNIVIKYTATLNDEADRTDTGNDNVAKLIFSNDPNHTYTGDEPNDNTVTGETPDKRTVTYTTGIAVQKTDENGKPLPGAKFEISGTKINRVLTHVTTYTASATGTYYKLKNGTYTDTAPTDTTEGEYESTTVKYAKTETDEFKDIGTDVSIIKTTDSTGYVSFEGLAAGTYTITEKEAPDGYKKSDNVYEIVIGANPTLLAPGWTLTYGTGATAGLPAIDSDDLNQDGPILYTFTVQNIKSHDLPITGGMGTTIFYVAGSVLMLAGVALLIYKKKSVSKA